jgi:hypothetical protein
MDMEHCLRVTQVILLQNGLADGLDHFPMLREATGDFILLEVEQDDG